MTPSRSASSPLHTGLPGCRHSVCERDRGRECVRESTCERASEREGEGARVRERDEGTGGSAHGPHAGGQTHVCGQTQAVKTDQGDVTCRPSLARAVHPDGRRARAGGARAGAGPGPGPAGTSAGAVSRAPRDWRGRRCVRGQPPRLLTACHCSTAADMLAGGFSLQGPRDGPGALLRRGSCVRAQGRPLVDLWPNSLARTAHVRAKLWSNTLALGMEEPACGRPLARLRVLLRRALPRRSLGASSVLGPRKRCAHAFSPLQCSLTGV